MKDHEIRELVNQLRDIAIEYHGTQQLRERIARAVRAAMLAAAPQLPGSEPDTVPGKWIPVSERMPENKPGSYEYLVFEKLNNLVNHDYWNCLDTGDDTFAPFWNNYGGYVTHWMPLPPAPQEVKGE